MVHDTQYHKNPDQWMGVRLSDWVCDCESWAGLLTSEEDLHMYVDSITIQTKAWSQLCTDDCVKEDYSDFGFGQPLMSGDDYTDDSMKDTSMCNRRKLTVPEQRRLQEHRRLKH